MKYLNLTEGFNPYNCSDNDLIRFESFFFSGGEPHIKLDISSFQGKKQDVQVTSRLRSMNDVGMLLVATEALMHCGFLDTGHLFIPYFPGARQDRRTYNGEPLTSSVYAQLVNSLGYSNVKVFDPHSDVSGALINNFEGISNYKFVKTCTDSISLQEIFFVVSPDAGANKKIAGLSINNGYSNILKCDKSRDTLTGKLTGFEVYKDDLEGKPCVIVDDICDGGSTFIGLAKELQKKNAGDLYLIVSHGIFSNGFKELRKYFKLVYTTDSWYSNIPIEVPEKEKGSEIIKIIPFNKFL